MVVSLNSRLESNKEEEEVITMDSKLTSCCRGDNAVGAIGLALEPFSAESSQGNYDL